MWLPEGQVLSLQIQIPTLIFINRYKDEDEDERIGKEFILTLIAKMDLKYFVKRSTAASIFDSVSSSTSD